jgi:hypothetical protein
MKIKQQLQAAKAGLKGGLIRWLRIVACSIILSGRRAAAVRQQTRHPAGRLRSLIFCKVLPAPGPGTNITRKRTLAPYATAKNYRQTTRSGQEYCDQWQTGPLRNFRPKVPGPFLDQVCTFVQAWIETRRVYTFDIDHSFPISLIAQRVNPIGEWSRIQGHKSLPALAPSRSP